MKPATPTPTAKQPDPSIATIEAMIADLQRMRDAERNQEIRNAYKAAIDGLVALAYRLRSRGRSRSACRPSGRCWAHRSRRGSPSRHPDRRSKA